MDVPERISPMSVPWIESPQFQVELINRSAALTPRQRDVAQELNRDGYAVLRGAVDPALCDSIRAETEPLFETDYAEKERRVPDAWRQGATSVRSLAVLAEIQADLSALYGRKPIPFQTLNFKWGTEQGFHADAIHFTSMPDRFMCGVWVALEDVDDANGPLAYLPGSHRLVPFASAEIGIDPDRFARAEETQLEVMKRTGVQPVEFHAKKGDALIWTATVLHGGMPIKAEGRTRWSQVTHYYFEECIYYQPIYSSALTGEVKLMEIVNLNDLEPVPQRYEGLNIAIERLPNGRCLLGVVDGSGNEILGSAQHLRHLREERDAARREVQELRESASFQFGNALIRPLSRALRRGGPAA
jgi:Phytanoyl-CoA dioxygenase (PhyH)